MKSLSSEYHEDLKDLEKNLLKILIKLYVIILLGVVIIF